ncbi:MAG: hypothetical protein ABIG84_07020 [archaeon]
MNKEKMARLQIKMSANALKELEDLQKKIDASTRTQVIKSSLKVYRFLEDEKSKGSKIIIKDKEGKEREIIL